MSHALEPATTGRSKCRACRATIAKDTLRIGERAPNPFGDGEAVYWFHPECAALKRPHVVVELADADPEDRVDGPVLDAQWVQWARRAVAAERLARVGEAGRAPSGRARCRQCRDLIDKHVWRVALDIWEEGRFAPLGFVHAGCLSAYCRVETTGDLVERVLHGAALSPEDSAALREAVETQRAATEPSGH